MPRDRNFLLGSGERLAGTVKVARGGGSRTPPYDLAMARQRLGVRLERVVRVVSELPADACPDGEAVAVMTLHPRYIAKSDFPLTLLSEVGLRAVGSRTRELKPERWGLKRPPEGPATTTDLFVAGRRDAFTRWAHDVRAWPADRGGAEELAQVEDIRALRGGEKVRGIDDKRQDVLLEVVLHNSGAPAVLGRFATYVERLGGEVLVKRSRTVGGLTFVPVRAGAGTADALADFSRVRVARGMPTLRPVQPGVLRGVPPPAVVLPQVPPLAPRLRAAIFDGGVPMSPDLSPWVREVVPPRLGPAVPAFQEHGLAVTGAFLFGPIGADGTTDVPLCHVDHVRVLDAADAQGNDLEYLDVLDRILHVLDTQGNEYDFLNISIGPDLPAEDDDVTVWTAELDARLASARHVATIAVGNRGESDASARLNRIQPPADAVNALAVGACDKRGDGWARAAYSCVGPGRSPGVAKPDGLVHGGSAAEPLLLLTSGGSPAPHAGTSFASPLALRAGAAIRVQLGTALSPNAVRALLIHRADPGSHLRPEVGWGRFDDNPETLITCEDHEALVVYQGELPIGEHLRAPLPLKGVVLTGMVTVAATLVIAPDVDPEHPAAYTRAGLEVVFRPNATRHRRGTDGNPTEHAASKSFFSSRSLAGLNERELRAEDFKWEPCRKHAQRFQAASLHEPHFDIYYHSREGAAAVSEPRPMPYALVVSIHAPRVTDLYNQVMQQYAQILVPLRPQIRVPVRLR